MIIETKNLTIGYGDKIIHSGLNLTLKVAELTSILGVNGSGKSTLIRTLCGLMPSLGGEIYICGKKINEYSKPELSSIISVVLTERVNDGGLTVYEIVSLGRYPFTGFFGRLSPDDRLMVEKSLNDVGIWDMRDKFISELSDGERQKVMIAKSLAQESKIIILDEPTSFLDLRSRMEIIGLLRKLAAEKGTTFLLSLHDLELSLQYSDSLWIMCKNGGVECGQTESLVLSGAINKAAGNTLEFNISTGVFKPLHNTLRKIKYEGVDLLWVKNALSRIGYSFGESDTVVEVTNYSNIKVTKAGNTVQLSSIAELSDLLSN